MSWETITVAVEELGRVLERIRRTGATVTHCAPVDDEYVVTYCFRRGAA